MGRLPRPWAAPGLVMAVRPSGVVLCGTRGLGGVASSPSSSRNYCGNDLPAAVTAKVLGFGLSQIRCVLLHPFARYLKFYSFKFGCRNSVRPSPDLITRAFFQYQPRLNEKMHSRGDLVYEVED